MCTVSFLPSATGYRLGMNRDEQRSRVKGIFPGVQSLKGVGVLGPCEPNGGRWVVVNSHGVAFALLNCYAKSEKPVVAPVSRGRLVESVATDQTPDEVERRLGLDSLIRYRPFRLIGVFGEIRRVVEWRWDGGERGTVLHRWEANLWASSGFDEPGAQMARRVVFDEFCRSAARGIGNLESFHRSHEPQKGALSVCMHREEAATVSFSEFEVGNEVAKGTYVEGPPCESKNRELGQMPLSSPGWPQDCG